MTAVDSSARDRARRLLGSAGDAALRNLTQPKNGAPAVDEQTTAPAEATCQAMIWPPWANRWTLCGSQFVNGRCVSYGHKRDSAENERLRTDAAASRRRADTHQERADQLAVDLMAFADNMHTMADQCPANTEARKAYQAAEQRVRDMLVADRARENGS